MSTFALEETLEADWVAVRPHAFHEREKQKFVFIVAWNEIESKFAITCHNRTAQRQRSGSRELRRTSAVGPGAAEQLSASCKTAGSPTIRKPPAGRGAESVQARSSPASPVRAESLPRSPGSRAVEASQRSPARTKSNLARRPQPVPKAPFSPAACAAEDLEELELGKDEPSGGAAAAFLLPSLPAGPPAESPTAALDEVEALSGEECSWAGLFSFQDLRTVHQQLSSVNSELEPCLPVLPEEPSGMWTVLFGTPELSEEEMDALCYQLQVYLGHCLDTCGWKILSQVLFTETDDPEEYYESLSELRQKGYEEVLQRARKRIQELLEKHKNTESMVELLELYQMEDDAYGSLAEATTELYQYLLQPFRDMRELAMLRRQQIKISIENDYLGPRRIESLQKEDTDWQRKAHMAVLSIQDLTVKYFEITAKAQKAVYDRMRADQKKFGKAAWAAAVERMEKLQYAVSKDTLQLMRAKEICLEQKKHALKEEMQSLQGGTEAIAHLDELEADYYDLQLQLYEVQFEILKCEELLLTAQLESIKRLISEKRDEVVYYDTYESMEAMLEKEDMAASIHLQREELQKLQQKVRQLEARRGRISAKKAYLKNKKEICIAKHNEKLSQHSQSEGESEHATKFKRERLQDEVERKSSWVSQERQKTLDRLRTFKQRYPGQVILKSTRLRLAHARRKTLISNEFHSNTISEAPLPPPLPPPPPPPLPTKEESTQCSEKSTSPVKQSSAEKPAPLITIAPSAHFFDSSELVSAKKKLKKTGDIEGLQRRRVSSPMDEVLASLKPSMKHYDGLRKHHQSLKMRKRIYHAQTGKIKGPRIPMNKIFVSLLNIHNQQFGHHLRRTILRNYLICA
ncbi:junction-mediating and -regulatory protein [Crotalus adamanteus]|uniref:Junction-mediating and -regulatory protein n=1 Tax=Crotalus adamanteus TaxID=8729 RepID=A0AAW1C2D4_CROAD